MAILQGINFQLVNTNDDYIEFTVTYTLGLDLCIASGIGWLANDISKYYLRLLRVNGKPAPVSSYKKARIVMKYSSYSFKDKKLDAATQEGIFSSFRMLPTTRSADNDEKHGQLTPRFPSLRKTN